MDTTLPNFVAGQLNFGGAGPYNATGPVRNRPSPRQIQLPAKIGF